MYLDKEGKDSDGPDYAETVDYKAGNPAGTKQQTKHWIFRFSYLLANTKSQPIQPVNLSNPCFQELTNQHCICIVHL